MSVAHLSEPILFCFKFAFPPDLLPVDRTYIRQTLKQIEGDIGPVEQMMERVIGHPYSIGFMTAKFEIVTMERSVDVTEPGDLKKDIATLPHTIFAVNTFDPATPSIRPGQCWFGNQDIS